MDETIITYDWIEGSKFVQIADFVYSPFNKAEDDYAKYPNTFNIEKLKDVNLVYTNVMYVARLFRILQYLPQKFVVMSHNGDEHPEMGVMGRYESAKKVREESYPYPLSQNIIKWFTVNVDFEDPRVEVLPLGMENSMWKHSAPKRQAIINIMRNPPEKSGDVYMCFGVNTNVEERQKVFNMFKDKEWVTVVSKASYEDFYKNIASHRFVLNPQGNCFDNHRMWESWHLGSIPISKSSICINFYKDMPMVIVNDWKQVTKKFLDKEYERITNMDWDRRKLTFEYWKNKVLSAI